MILTHIATICRGHRVQVPFGYELHKECIYCTRRILPPSDSPQAFIVDPPEFTTTCEYKIQRKEDM